MNRIAEVAVATPLKNRFELESQLRQLDYKPAELAGALKDTFAISPAKGGQLGRAYARNLDLNDHRELFQRTARSTRRCYRLIGDPMAPLLDAPGARAAARALTDDVVYRSEQAEVLL